MGLGGSSLIEFPTESSVLKLIDFKRFVPSRNEIPPFFLTI